MEAVDVRGLLGLLLADGSLVQYRSPGGGYVQLTLTAGVQESAFLEEKVAEFRVFMPTRAQIVPYRTAIRSTGKATTVLRFRVSSNRLRTIYNLLYPHGERRVTSLVLEMLGGRAAAWLWAEGARPQPDGSVELKRVGRQAGEAALISDWLETLTGASSQILPDYIKPRLHFTPEGAAKIRSALADYAPPSRIHLFTGTTTDVHTIRSYRTELLSRQGQDRAQGPQAQTVADPA
ncbi:MAG: hypothetical protein ABFD94_13285 [Armatimonadia bacterium]